MTENMTLQEVYQWLQDIDSNSIYDNDRLAHPDEVANYKTGDGLEKAFFLANVIHKKDPGKELIIAAENGQVSLKAENEYKFASDKNLKKQVFISGQGELKIMG